MNFTSQICTTKIQSERLLALGLKRETADCIITQKVDGTFDVFNINCGLLEVETIKYASKLFVSFPAWSLHRLIEMMPSFVDIGEHTYMFSMIQGRLFSYCSDIAGYALLYGKGSVYDSAIYTIEWLIKEGYFNKEYLEEKL